MTVTVTEEDGAHRAAVHLGGTFLVCCEAGHETPEEAALHAHRLTRAMERRAEADG